MRGIILHITEPYYMASTIKAMWYVQREDTQMNRAE